MSNTVQFQQQTTRATVPVGSGKNDTAHKIGEALTGGKSQSGYLAVQECASLWFVTMGLTGHIGIPRSTAEKPAPHQDAHIWLPRRAPRSHRLMARTRSKQAWPLLQLQSAQDGCLWRLRKRANGPSTDQNAPRSLRRSY
jgi:hypothetical protein